MKLYQQQFDAHLDQPAAGVLHTVLIASTPRCGSHMLGHAMASTGLLGVPFEYANPVNLAEWRVRLGTTTPQATMAALMTRRTTTNGVFAIKAHFSQCDSLGGATAFLDFWPNLKVVHLCRADVMRQAISYAIARQTGVWIVGQEAENDSVRYDARLIAECLDDIAVQNAGWTSAFAKAGITPLTLRYREVAADPSEAVSRIARHVGAIDADCIVDVAATTIRQGQVERTEDWIRRYASERRPAARRRFSLRPLARLVRA